MSMNSAIKSKDARPCVSNVEIINKH